MSTPRTIGPRGLLELTDAGLYCPAGDFHIDPWKAVDRAVITHGHSDHARPGSQTYLASQGSEEILRRRLGRDITLDTLPYGETVIRNGAKVSLHPAGHVLGSAQVRIDVAGAVVVVSGDYATMPNPTCAAFEPIRCHSFVTECTFGLPIYRWPDSREVFAGINAWWSANRAQRRTSVVYAYGLGKAQRVLAGVDRTIGPILVHGAVRGMNAAYHAAGVDLPETIHATAESIRHAAGGALVVAPPSAARSPWLNRFRPLSSAFVSGWMAIRGTRRRRAADRGFVLSDHADWDGLMGAIESTGAEHIGVTHGFVEPMARRLREFGHSCDIVPTHFEASPDAELAGEEETSPDNNGDIGNTGSTGDDGAST